MTPPRNPETQSLPLLHLCTSDLCGVTFLWASDALAVFDKGFPFDDIFKGYSLTFADLWSFVLLKYRYLPQSSAFNRGNLEKQPWQNPR